MTSKQYPEPIRDVLFSIPSGLCLVKNQCSNNEKNFSKTLVKPIMKHKKIPTAGLQKGHVQKIPSSQPIR